MCPKSSLERWRLQGVACLYKTERPESLCYCASHQPLANTANRLPAKTTQRWQQWRRMAARNRKRH